MILEVNIYSTLNAEKIDRMTFSHGGFYAMHINFFEYKGDNYIYVVAHLNEENKSGKHIFIVLKTRK